MWLRCTLCVSKKKSILSLLRMMCTSFVFLLLSTFQIMPNNHAIIQCDTLHGFRKKIYLWRLNIKEIACKLFDHAPYPVRRSHVHASNV